MKNKFFAWAKDVFSQTISQLAAGVGVLLVSYAFPFTRSVLKEALGFWKELLIALGFCALLALFLKVRKLIKQLADLKSKQDTYLTPTPISQGPSKKEFEKIKGDVDKTNEQLRDLVYDVYDLKRDYLYQKAKRHQQLHQNGALICRLEVIEIDTKQGFDFNLSESLDELLRYVRETDSFNTDQIASARNILTNISSAGHKTTADEILKIMSSKL